MLSETILYPCGNDAFLFFVTCGVWEKSKHGLSCTVEEMYSRSREVDMESESTCSLMTDTVERMEWECVRTQSEKQAT